MNKAGGEMTPEEIEKFGTEKFIAEESRKIIDTLAGMWEIYDSVHGMKGSRLFAIVMDSMVRIRKDDVKSKNDSVLENGYETLANALYLQMTMQIEEENVKH